MKTWGSGSINCGILVQNERIIAKEIEDASGNKTQLRL